MNPFIWPCECSVCGGEGVTTNRGNIAQWTGGFLQHIDPWICAEVIQARERELTKRIKQLEEKQSESKAEGE